MEMRGKTPKAPLALLFFVKIFTAAALSPSATRSSEAFSLSK